MTADYSETPLAKKLGIKDGFRIRLINEPSNYFNLFADLPGKLTIARNNKNKADFIHLFTKELKEVEKQIPLLKNEIESNGIIWISWPKKASKVPTDITEDMIRKIVLENGLVDIKVCAVDETWSGLKLVIPVKDRIR
ncbi:MAG: hypothetical protein JWN78_1895 [Bacteroidota bacterium]|nr:hypothetical protein [Bacteroidota bacterium]